VGNMESWERTVKKIREKSDTSSSSFIVIHPPSLPSIYTSSLSPSSLSSLRVPPLLPAQTSRRHIFWLPWERFWWWHAPIVFFSFKKNSFYYYYIPPLSFFLKIIQTHETFFFLDSGRVCVATRHFWSRDLNHSFFNRVCMSLQWPKAVASFIGDDDLPSLGSKVDDHFCV
jgi:hypothetical protein